MHFPDRCQKRRERKGLCHSNGMSRRMESKNYKLFSCAVTYKSCCLINKIWHSTCVIEYRKQVALPCGLKWERTGFCGSTFSSNFLFFDLAAKIFHTWKGTDVLGWFSWMYINYEHIFLV